jgi:hypothetical protein
MYISLLHFTFLIIVESHGRKGEEDIKVGVVFLQTHFRFGKRPTTTKKKKKRTMRKRKLRSQDQILHPPHLQTET